MGTMKEIRNWYNQLTNLNRMLFILFVIMNTALSINPLIIYNAPIVLAFMIVIFGYIKVLKRLKYF